MTPVKNERKDNDDEEADAGGPEEIIAQSILIGSIVCCMFTVNH